MVKKYKKYSFNERIKYYNDKFNAEFIKGKKANKNVKDYCLGYFSGAYKGKRKLNNMSISYQNGNLAGGNTREKLYNIKF